MVLSKLFKKSKVKTDFKSNFDQKTFLVETIFDLIDFVDSELRFKEAVVGERHRFKYYRTDAIVKLFFENQGKNVIFKL